MRNTLIFIFFFIAVFSFHAADKTRTYVISKNQYDYLETNDLLIKESVNYALGITDPKATKIEIKQVFATSKNLEEFPYFPESADTKKKKDLKAEILGAGINKSLKLRVIIDQQNSKLSDEIKKYIDEKGSFIVSLVILGERNVFVTESKTNEIFNELIEDRKFIEKSLRTYFGRSSYKKGDEISFVSKKACLSKTILSIKCTDEFDLSETNATYDEFVSKITSPDYSHKYVYFDLLINREGSRLNQKIEDAIIKEKDGSEHIKFVFCIPEENQKSKPRKRIEIVGRLKSENNSPVKDVMLDLRDANNQVVASRFTDSLGNFSFDDLKEGLAYTIFINKSFKSKNFSIYTAKDTLIGDFNKTKGGFDYKLLESDINKLAKIEEAEPVEEFKTNIRGKMVVVTDKINPLSEQKIELKSSNNEVLQTKSTDKDGFFEFTSLNPELSYYIELTDYQTKAKNEKVYMANSKNELVTQFHKNAAGKFSYMIIPSDIYYMSRIEDEDLQMSFDIQKKSSNEEIVIRDFVYFALNSSELSPESFKVLDNVVRLLEANKDYKLDIISYTDSRGDKNENLKLSEKRSESVMAYIVKKNIDSDRLKSVGMGEARLLNNCTDGITCSEDEHKMNRRTEFVFYKN